MQLDRCTGICNGLHGYGHGQGHGHGYIQLGLSDSRHHATTHGLCSYWRTVGKHGKAWFLIDRVTILWVIENDTRSEFCLLNQIYGFQKKNPPYEHKRRSIMSDVDLII